MKYEIGDPIPVESRKQLAPARKYPFDKLEVGKALFFTWDRGSMTSKEEWYNRLRSAAHNHAKRNHWKLRTNMLEDGRVQVYRLPDDAIIDTNKVDPVPAKPVIVGSVPGPTVFLPPEHETPIMPKVELDSQFEEWLDGFASNETRTLDDPHSWELRYQIQKWCELYSEVTNVKVECDLNEVSPHDLAFIKIKVCDE